MELWREMELTLLVAGDKVKSEEDEDELAF